MENNQDEVDKGSGKRLTFGDSTPIHFIALPNKWIGMVTHFANSSIYEDILLNLNHPFIKWFHNILGAYYEDKLDLQSRAIRRLAKLIEEVIRYPSLRYKEFKDYLEKWKEIPNLPSGLYLPEVKEEDVNLYSWETRLRKMDITKYKQKRKKETIRAPKKKVVKNIKP